MDDLPLAWNNGQDLVVVLEDRNKDWINVLKLFTIFWKDGNPFFLSKEDVFFGKIMMESCFLGRFTWESTVRWMKKAQNPSKSQKFAEIYQNLPKFTKIYQNLPKFAKICQYLPKFAKLLRNSHPFWHFNGTAHFALFKLEPLGLALKRKKVQDFEGKNLGDSNCIKPYLIFSYQI
jgi:hypothetical protein